MSLVKIQGNASGTGEFTIAAPNSNTNRTLTLPDATGTVVVTGGAQTIEFAAGSSSAPSITTTGDTNTGIFFPAADTIAFTEGGTESMRVDSSGNLGLGTSSPDTRLHVSGTTTVARLQSSSASTYLRLSNTTDTNGYLGYEGANMVFYAGNTERARITSGGYFKASNDGSYLNLTGPYHEFRTNGNDTTVLCTSMASSGNVFGVDMGFRNITPNNTTSWFYRGYDSTNDKCIIYSSGTITNRTGTYNSFSDLKLKQDVTDASSQWNDIKALRIVKYRLKDEVAADPNYPAHIGVIAQEVEQTSPGLIDNCVNKDSGEVTKSVKSSIIYMKAVKALQEAMDRIETLEAQNAAFEARLAALESK
jgi:hypothetical protein